MYIPDEIIKLGGLEIDKYLEKENLKKKLLKIIENKRDEVLTIMSEIKEMQNKEYWNTSASKSGKIIIQTIYKSQESLKQVKLIVLELIDLEHDYYNQIDEVIE